VKLFLVAGVIHAVLVLGWAVTAFAQGGSTGGSLGKTDRELSGSLSKEGPVKGAPKSRTDAPESKGSTSFVNVSGRWQLKLECGSFGNYAHIFQVTHTGDRFAGSISNPGEGGGSRVRDGKVSGSTITFIRDSWEGQQSWTGTVSGGQMSGSLQATMGIKCSWHASR
jgi:hypothetical protein